MQTTSIQSLEMFAGDTRALTFSVVDDSGNSVNLTGGVVVWQLAASNWRIDPTVAPMLTKSSATAGQVTLANGSFTVNLASVDTQGLTEGNYYHEAQATLADGITIGTPVSGKIKIKKNLIAPR
jgi:hypothetical protein